jgi:cytochrome c oxidase accessory protein FixG
MTSASPRPSQETRPVFVEESLYEVHQKVHPRAVSGIFATWRWTMAGITQLVYYGLCWLPWNGRQAVLFDLVERKFYIFGLVFWPQDVIFLAILLIICAYSLFLFTAVGGRLWCGYACPQTVYTEIFTWIEQKLEGDRNARIKLDAAPMSARKLWLRSAKYGLWVTLALWTGFTFVGYFTPIKAVWTSLWSFSLGPWETFWMLFYSAFTYLFAGHMREQVCKHMCPYARFQGVMFDPDTLTITYDSERGESRGPRKKGLDPKAIGKGDCVDCGICVQVCPTGIDIRDGLQYECIGCAACIDACDQVMVKMDYPKGLIRYSTEHAIEAHWGWKEIIGHVVRPRVVIYTAILAALCVAFVWGIATKPSLRVDVIRDRATLAREVEGGLIENVYRLHVINISEAPHRYAISVSGLPQIDLVGDRIVEVPAAASKSITVQVRVPPESGNKGSNQIFFDVKSIADETVAVHEKASFLQP